MTEKTMEAVKNDAGGLDLVIERDAGDEVRIPMGGPRDSLAAWEELLHLASSAVETLEAGHEARVRSLVDTLNEGR